MTINGHIHSIPRVIGQSNIGHEIKALKSLGLCCHRKNIQQVISTQSIRLVLKQKVGGTTFQANHVQTGVLLQQQSIAIADADDLLYEISPLLRDFILRIEMITH